MSWIAIKTTEGESMHINLDFCEVVEERKDDLVVIRMHSGSSYQIHGHDSDDLLLATGIQGGRPKAHKTV